MRNADVIHMAHTIESLSAVGDDGLIMLCPLETYATAVGVTVDEADCLIDEALEVLVSEGTFTERRGEHYLTEQLEAYEDSLEDFEQAMLDEMQSYDLNVWR